MKSVEETQLVDIDNVITSTDGSCGDVKDDESPVNQTSSNDRRLDANVYLFPGDIHLLQPMTGEANTG